MTGMGAFDILTIIGVVGGIPVIAKLFIYYFYLPDVKIFFPPVNNLPPINPGGTVTSDRIYGIHGPHIINKSGRTLKLKVEFTTNKLILENDTAKSFGYFKNRKGMQIYVPRFVSEDGRKWAEEGIFPSDCYECEIPFPYKISEEFSLKVKIYIGVELSELGMPRFFGDMELKPIIAEFKIRPAVRAGNDSKGVEHRRDNGAQ